MRRRASLLACVAFVACSAPKFADSDLLPTSVGIWNRTELKRLPGTGHPEPLPREVARALEARYEGAGSVQAQVFELPSSAVSLDVVQRRRPEADTVAINKDRYVYVVRWSGAERGALAAFIAGLTSKVDSLK